MDLRELGDLILLTSSSGSIGLKNRKFGSNKFEPTNLFKKLDKLELSYSTINQFKECMVKFFMRKFMDLGFFKTNEALFLGNTVHKFLEDMVTTYVNGKLNFDTYNDTARMSFNDIKAKFDKESYVNGEEFVESIFKYVSGRKRFEPDIFFDDISFISSIYTQDINYVERNKMYFQNAAKLLKILFTITDKVHAHSFNMESWIRFSLNDLPIKFPAPPVTFLGKIDLYFKYKQLDQDYLAIIDFKTGKKDYFSWDQLHYYSLYFGKDLFGNIQKYFFDLKEGDRYLCNESIDYYKIENDLKTVCGKISDMYVLYDMNRDALSEKYTKKLASMLKKVKASDEVYKVPCDIVMMVFDLINKDFFKAQKIDNYHSNGGFACTFCDHLNFCSIRS